MKEDINIHNFLSEVRQDIKMAYEEQDYEKAICCSKFLCSFFYEYDLKFHDIQMETYTQKIAQKCIDTIELKNTNKNKVLFYDKFGLNQRGLANIYIRALLDLGYEVTWCLFDYAPEINDILMRYGDEERLHFELIPRLPVIDRMHTLQQMIIKTNAYHHFIYTIPSDMECLGVFSVMTGDICRYLINLTDHTFWLGTCALDYCIEFRNLGANISTQYRNLKKEQLMILPYYPEKKSTEFQGLPFSETEEFFFSGGSSYKIEGSHKFEQIVTNILDKYQHLKFIFATNDECLKLNRLASKYKERIFVINERKDLDEILQRAKFYLSTYPIPGGLMIQYALSNNCIPLCLSDENNKIASLDSYLLNPEQIDFVFYDIDELLKKVDAIMLNDESDNKQHLKEHFIISEKEFQVNLANILKGKNTNYHYYEEDFDASVFHTYYMNRLTQDNFRKTVKSSNNRWLAEKYPEIFSEDN